jgi:hypothetical protein
MDRVIIVIIAVTLFFFISYPALERRRRRAQHISRSLAEIEFAMPPEPRKPEALVPTSPTEAPARAVQAPAASAAPSTSPHRLAWVPNSPTEVPAQDAQAPAASAAPSTSPHRSALVPNSPTEVPAQDAQAPAASAAPSTFRRIKSYSWFAFKVWACWWAAKFALIGVYAASPEGWPGTTNVITISALAFAIAVFWRPYVEMIRQLGLRKTTQRT